MSIRSISTLQYLFLFLFAFVLVGCETNRSVTIQRLEPSDLGLSSNSETLLVIDRHEHFDQFDIGIADDMLANAVISIAKGEDRKTRRQRYYKEAIDEYIAGAFSKALSDPAGLDVVTLDLWQPSESGLEGISREEMVPEFVTNYAREFRADIVVVLDRIELGGKHNFSKFKTVFTIPIGGDGKSSNSKKNKKSKVNVDANARVLFRLYSGSSGAIIDEVEVARSLQKTIREDSKSDSDKQMIRLARSALNECFKEYAYYLVPHYRKVERDLYREVDGVSATLLSDAYGFAKEGNWEAAESLWNKALSGLPETSRGRSRLLTNLAIAAESIGDIEQALELATAAEQIESNESTRHYVDLLNKSKEARDHANTQLVPAFAAEPLLL